MSVSPLPLRLTFTLVAAFTSLPVTAQESVQKVTFDDHVKPIFQQRCAACHNGDKQSGGLNLSNFTSLMQGGSSGAAIEPGDAGGSWLYMLITHQETPEMPPGGTKIPDEEISRIEAWISAGALENSGSVAKTKSGGLVAGTVSIGMRPEIVAVPSRMSLEPFFHSTAPGMSNSIAIHPWAPVVAVAAPKQILLFNMGNMELTGSIPFPEGQANALHFSRNGQLLIAGGGRHGLVGKVVVWDIATADRILEVGDEPDNVLAADLSADHALIAMGGPQKIVRVYSAVDGKLLYEISKHTDWITALEFSPDGVLLASADRNGGLQIWEAVSGSEYLNPGSHEKAIADISWRADGNVLATAGDDGTVRMWEMENGGQIKSWTAHANGATAVRFLRSGQLVSTGRDSLAKIWQPDGQHLRDLPGLQEVGVSVGYCEETGSVIAASLAGDVAVWKADDGTLRGNLDANPPPIANRLQAASESLQLATNNLQPLESQLAAAEESVAKLNAELNAQQTALAQFSRQLYQAREQIQSINEQSQSAAAQRGAWQNELDGTRQAIPLLAEALKNAMAASNLLPQDQPLKDSTIALEQRHQQLTASASTLETSIGKSTQSTEEQQSQIPGLNQAMMDTESKMAAASTAIDQLTQQVEPANKQKTELLEKIAAAKREVEVFQAQVNRWQDETVFHQTLAVKLQELSDARQQVDAKHAALLSAEAELKSTQTDYDQRLADKQGSEQAVSNVQEEIKKLRTPK